MTHHSPEDIARAIRSLGLGRPPLGAGGGDSERCAVNGIRRFEEDFGLVATSGAIGAGQGNGVDRGESGRRRAALDQQLEPGQDWSDYPRSHRGHRQVTRDELLTAAVVVALVIWLVRHSAALTLWLIGA